MQKKRYYLLEKNEHGGHSSKLWTFEELKDYFEPPEGLEEAAITDGIKTELYARVK